MGRSPLFVERYEVGLALYATMEMSDRLMV